MYNPLTLAAALSYSNFEKYQPIIKLLLDTHSLSILIQDGRNFTIIDEALKQKTNGLLNEMLFNHEASYFFDNL